MLEVALLAEDDSIDPLLTLYANTDVEGEVLMSDDDGGEGLNSLLRFTLPKTGTYTIGVGTYGESAGSYTLRVAEPRVRPEQAALTPLGLGERSIGYAEGVNYAAYDEYAENAAVAQTPAANLYQLSATAIAAIRAGAGEVTVDMTHPLIDDPNFPSGVDPFLELGFETPLGFASMMSNDDGGEFSLCRIRDKQSCAMSNSSLTRIL